MRILIPLLFLITTLFFSGCSVTPEVFSETRDLPYAIHDGIVTYPDNLYFPSRVTLTISMYGYTEARSDSTLIVSQQIRNPQRFPVNYTLRYLEEETSLFKYLYIEYLLTREGETQPYMQAKGKSVTPNQLSTTVTVPLTRNIT